MCKFFSSDTVNNHNQEEGKAGNESPTETIPLQQRLNESVLTRRSMRLLTKTEKERTPIVLVRDIDRAASLPIEKKSYLFDYTLGERERGYSVQRDKVIFFLQIIIILIIITHNVLSIFIFCLFYIYLFTE